MHFFVFGLGLSMTDYPKIQDEINVKKIFKVKYFLSFNELALHGINQTSLKRTFVLHDINQTIFMNQLYI